MRLNHMAALCGVAALLALPALAQDDPVVAKVEGATIKLSDVQAAQEQLPEQYRQMPMPAVFDQLLTRLIDERLLAKRAAAENLAADPLVQEKVRRAADLVIQNEVLERAIATGSTPERLQQAYDQLRAQPGFAREQVRAHHVLVATEDEAKAVVTRLDAGEKIEDIAKTGSLDPSGAQSGGDLGFFTRDMMVPSFADAAFTIEPGTYGKTPVKSEFGWHVIRVDERRNEVPSLEEKTPELRQQVARELVGQLIQDIRKGAAVERFAMDGSVPTPNAAPEAPAPAPAEAPKAN